MAGWREEVVTKNYVDKLRRRCCSFHCTGPRSAASLEEQPPGFGGTRCKGFCVVGAIPWEDVVVGLV